MALKATAGVQCAEEHCTSMSHKKTACSGISKYSSDKWRCNAHRKEATRETDHTTGRARAPTESQELGAPGPFSGAFLDGQQSVLERG